MDIISPSYEFNIGPVANFGPIDQPGFANFQAAKLSHDTYDITDLIYDPVMEGFRLTPFSHNADPVRHISNDFIDMDPTAWDFFQYVGGSWAADSPWEISENPYRGSIHLHQRYIDDVIERAAQSHALFPVAPCIQFRVAHPFDCNPTSDVMIARLYFGFTTDHDTQGYILDLFDWDNPKLYGPVPTGGTQRVLLSTYKLSETEQKDYQESTYAYWFIENFNGDLVIQCTALKTRWVARGVGDVPAGYVRVETYGTGMAFAAQNVVYPTTGSFITDWIDHGTSGPFTLGLTYPYYMPPGCAVTVTSTTSLTSSNLRQYTVSVTSDGKHTPIIRGLSCLCRPVPHDPRPDPEWNDCSALFFSGEEKLELDDAGSTITLHFRNAENQFTDYLAALGAQYAVGQMSFEANIGYLFRSDELTAETTMLRMSGLVKNRIEHNALQEMNYTLECRSRSSQLCDTELINSPCVLHFPVDEAIAILAEWGGIHPDDIIINCAASSGTILPWVTRAPAVVGESLDPAIERYCLGNEESLEQPDWFLDGENDWEAVKRIGDRYGVTIELSGGKLYIRETTFREMGTTPAYTFTTEEGADNTVALSELDVNNSIDNKYNAVKVEGMDVDGKGIIAVLRDTSSITSPGTDGFIGYEKAKRLADHELFTPEQVNVAANWFLQNNRPGLRSLAISSPCAALWNTLPRDLVYINDAGTSADSRYFRLKSVSGTYTLTNISTSAEAQEVDPTRPALWSGAGMQQRVRLIDRVINLTRPIKPLLTASGSASYSLNPPTGDGGWFTIAISDIAGPDQLHP